MSNANKMSVCVLCYGDYYPLAHRCLESIRESLTATSGWQDMIADVRIGLNDVASDTTAYVLEDVAVGLSRRFPVKVYIPERNVGKYPLMRRMFYDPSFRLADNVMWFDDDSFIDNQKLLDGWWWQVQAQLRCADMISQLWWQVLRASQAAGIRAQPWYTGKAIAPSHRVLFAAGGWWAARSYVLRKHDWPFPEIHNNGGDSILGELFRQQSYLLERWHKCVEINIEPRRGLTTRWPFENYNPVDTVDLSHQNFRGQTRRYEAMA